jgi:hypothetical protein
MNETAFPRLCLSLVALMACGDAPSGDSVSDSNAASTTGLPDDPTTSGDPSTDSATMTGTDDSGGSGSGGMDQCGGCPFTRPNILFVLDYSSTMNYDWDDQGSYYEHVRAALVDFLTLEVDLAQRMNFALMHYGHDPEPTAAGTSIAVDESGMVDGQKLDFPWTVGGLYVPCQNDELADGLVDIIPPAGGQTIGIGTWTKGALDFAMGLVQAQRAEHGEPVDGPPFYRVVLITDGQWTSANGTMVLAPPEEDPVLTADLLLDASVKTYVISVGEAVGAEFTNLLAASGGTVAAYPAVAPTDLPAQLTAVFQTIADEPGITPEDCSGLLP